MYRSPGLFIGLAVFLGVTLATGLIDFALSFKFDDNTRTGLWFGAIIGPWVGMWAYETWGAVVWGHLAGITGSLGGFVLAYFLNARLRPR